VPGVSGPSQPPQAGGGVGDICRKLWSSLEHADAAPATAEGTAAIKGPARTWHLGGRGTTTNGGTGSAGRLSLSGSDGWAPQAREESTVDG
jgi:hypothetical protein